VEYRSLGRTGVKVGNLCLGCMMFGGKTDPTESQRIIDRSLRQGHRLLPGHRQHGRQLPPKAELPRYAGRGASLEPGAFRRSLACACHRQPRRPCEIHGPRRGGLPHIERLRRWRGAR
jgi:hypothetical protein